MKYIITKADGSPVDPNAKYFVLRLDQHGPDCQETAAARLAVARYAELTKEDAPACSEAAANMLRELATPAGGIEALAIVRGLRREITRLQQIIDAHESQWVEDNV